MDVFNPLRWSLQLMAAWAVPGLKAWSLERSANRTQGERYLRAREYVEAERYLKAAVKEADTLRHTVRKVQFRLQLAEAQRKQGKMEEAEKTIRTALEYTARISSASGYVQCVDALAEVYHDSKDYPAMETALQEGVKIEAAMPHPDPVRMARRIHRLGTARHKNGRPEEAVAPLEKALKLQEEMAGPDHLETGNLLAELGIIHRAQENHREAQKCLNRAMRIHEQTLGRESDEALRDLHHLAGSLEESGNIEEASALYERMLGQKQLVVGGDLEELAELQFGLAGIFIGWSNYARARELLAEAVGTFKRKKNSRLAVTYETIAHVEECCGRLREAVAERARAAKVWEACGKARRSELVENILHRAELLDDLRKGGEASWLRERAAELCGLESEAGGADAQGA
jgi:tetratricopeptide (TPR) repeat protein